MKIKIESEEELYNSFDQFEETLSEDLISYINNKSELTSIKQKEDIEIISTKKIDENKFRKSFEKYCDEQLIRINRQQKINKTKQIGMLIVGIIFIIFSILLTDKMNVIILEIISTIGSFSIWESANSWLLQSKTIKFNKLRAIKLKNSEIKFENLKEYLLGIGADLSKKVSFQFVF